ncbi:MAG: hypothetical protein LBR74_03790 [Eubacterium sp.]|nr:hypothetical protein [Eubacterium sp.]
MIDDLLLNVGLSRGTDREGRFAGPDTWDKHLGKQVTIFLASSKELAVERNEFEKISHA